MRTLPVALLAIGLSAGCASVPSVAPIEAPAPRPVAVRLGPEIVLGKAPIVRSLAAAIDREGVGHALFASGPARSVSRPTLHDVTVGPEAAAANVAIDKLSLLDWSVDVDLAYDASGTAHAIAGNALYSGTGGTWTEVKRPPWVAWHGSAEWVENGPLSTPRFARGSGASVLVFGVPGLSVGAAPRWGAKSADRTATPGVNAARRVPSKLLVLRRSGADWGDAAALETATKDDVQAVAAAADAHGTVHLLYTHGINESPLGYVRLAPGAGNPHPPVGGRPAFATIDGKPWLERPLRYADGKDVAVDPDRGTALISVILDKGDDDAKAVTREVIDRIAGAPLLLARHAVAVRLASAGNGAFHALVLLESHGLVYPLMYARYADGAWSDLVPVGDAAATPPALAAAPDGRVLAVWLRAKDEAPVARWINP